MKKNRHNSKVDITKLSGTLIQTETQLQTYGEGDSMLVVDYDAHHYNEWFADSIESAYARIDKETATWMNINCVCDTKLTESVSTHFGFSQLVLSNLLNQDSWSTYLVYPEYSYLSLNTVRFDLERFEINVDRICCVLGKDILLTFQENSGPLFSKIRERIKESTGIVRRVGVDYLQYLLINTLLCQITSQLEMSDKMILSMENETDYETENQLISRCYKLKRLLIKSEVVILPQLLSLKKIIQTKAFIKDSHMCFYEDLQSRAYAIEITLKAQIQRLDNVQFKVKQT
ncbi:MAG: magnesium transporter [Crocinitomicaceae bacterium]|jgi:magnesium transporter